MSGTFYWHIKANQKTNPHSRELRETSSVKVEWHTHTKKETKHRMMALFGNHLLTIIQKYNSHSHYVFLTFNK